MQPWFNARKAAQVVAFFAAREGGAINVLKLVKLIYLADRENLSRYDFPITWDNFVSMDHGPVNSITFDCVNGMQGGEGWDEFVSGRAGYEVGIAKIWEDDDLDELSHAELGTLHETWGRFGHMSKYVIRDWTHANCPEWENPNGSSTPIRLSRVLKFLKKDDAESLENDLFAEREARAAFAFA